MPSWTRAPPESLMKTNGLPVCSDSSITSATLCEWTSPAEPPRTVKSWLARWTRRPSTDAGAGDDAVGGNFLAGHAEVGLAVLGEQADLLEAAGVDQGVDPLAGGELALLLLLGQPVGPAALLELLLSLARRSSIRSSIDLLLGAHRRSSFPFSAQAGCTVTLCDFSPTRIS